MEETLLRMGLEEPRRPVSLIDWEVKNKNIQPSKLLNPAVRYFNSDPQQSPLLECESILNNGYLDIIKTN